MYQAIYNEAALYERAFSYRDIEAEVSFLTQLELKYNQAPPKTILEYACGPGYHLKEFAKRGIKSFGMDLSPSMVQRAQRAGVLVEVGDMCAYQCSEPVSLSFVMLGSIHHLLDDDSLLSHLRCVAHNLCESGLHVIEAMHPDDFRLPRRRTSQWTIEDQEGHLSAEWSILRHIDQRLCLTALSIKDEPHQRTLRAEATLRWHTLDEFATLIDRAGSLQLVEVLGEPSLSVPFDSPEAWRMVLILQKRAC